MEKIKKVLVDINLEKPFVTRGNECQPVIKKLRFASMFEQKNKDPKKNPAKLQPDKHVLVPAVRKRRAVANLGGEIKALREENKSLKRQIRGLIASFKKSPVNSITRRARSRHKDARSKYSSRSKRDRTSNSFFKKTK